tara:strand:- start:14 stop:226 length:213 start_codon:yes stop_codon:yes gene_type:complete
MNLSHEGSITYESGDINQDGAINVSDVVLSVNIILGISPYNELADLNGDGIVNILDVIDIVNIVLENSSS